MCSGAPNGTLVARARRPGRRALDVGCGEGADAIWLAGRGWRATATDISAVALDRLRRTAQAAAVKRAAQAAAVEVDPRPADVAEGAPEPAGFDLVTTHDAALRHTDAAAIDGLLDAVAPGGGLLVVGHAPPQEATDGWVQPEDVAGHLDGAWVVEVLSTRPRPGTPAGSRHSYDVVLRVLRGVKARAERLAAQQGGRMSA